jgi:hypothetical protein
MAWSSGACPEPTADPEVYVSQAATYTAPELPFLAKVAGGDYDGAMQHRIPQSAQLSLRELFAAVTTCGLAFAAMFQQWHPVLILMGACVPLFWSGFICHVAGEAIHVRHIRGLGWLGGILSSGGIVIAASAALSFVLFLAVGVLSGLLLIVR